MFQQQLVNAALAAILGISAIAVQAENTVAKPSLETTSNCDCQVEDSDGTICCPHLR